MQNELELPKISDLSNRKNVDDVEKIESFVKQ